MKNLIFAFVLMFAGSCAAFAQADATISRAGDLQLGGTYSVANSDYVPEHIRGFGFYGDFDFREHFGVEAEFHQLNDPDPTLVYERTYEIGGRYVRHYGRFAPYAKVMVGRGVFNYPPDCLSLATQTTPPQPVSCTASNVNPATTGPRANLAYNMYALGGGADISVLSRLNVRVEYEYQRWSGFPANGLSPQVVSIGVAYHFPAGKLSAR